MLCLCLFLRRAAVSLQALMFSATMRLEEEVVNKERREGFVDSILSVSSRRDHHSG